MSGAALLFSAAAAGAQTAPPNKAPGQWGAGKGATTGMYMLHRSAALAFVLPAMQTELGLSSSQVSQMQAMKQQFITQAQQTASQVSAKRQQLDQALASTTPNTSDVKSLMSQLAQMEVDRKFAAYDTAQRMEGLLTPEQRSKLDSFTPVQMRNAIESHMTVAEHQQMWALMHGAMGPGGMMGGRGMMGGGMMQGQGNMGMMQGQGRRRPSR